MAGTLLTCGSLSSYFFLASGRFVLAFKALFVARLLSWWDLVAYSTTVSIGGDFRHWLAIKVLLFHTWSLFVYLAWKQTVTVILLPALPPFGGVLLGYVYIYEFWWVTPCGAVKSALRLPPSFWYCFCLAILFVCLNLVRSSPCGAGEIRRALPILLSYPTVVGR